MLPCYVTYSKKKQFEEGLMYKQSVRIKAHVTSVQTQMIYHKENEIWWWVGWRQRAERLQLGGGIGCLGGDWWFGSVSAAGW